MGEEDYVLNNRINEGRRMLTAMRSGTNGLRIETGRHYECKIPVQERTCWCCGEGIEDEKHFVVQCNYYQDERLDLFQSITEVTEGRCKVGRLQHTQPDILFNFLIGSGAQYNRAEVMKCVQTYLVRAMKKREEFCDRAGIILSRRNV